MHAVEAGLPLIGKGLDLVKHDFEMETMFDKHNTDMLRVNCGPIGGWCLMVRNPDDIDEVLVQKGDTNAYILKWPGALQHCMRYVPRDRAPCFVFG